MITSATTSDPAGFETLEIFANAPAFNQWLFDEVSPYCSGKIIEIGSGIGNLSQYFLKNFKDVTLTDLRNEYVEILNKKFTDTPGLTAVNLLDISSPNFDQTHSSLLNSFNTVIALNVIEHIAADDLAINNCRKLLAPNGRLIVLVPAYPALYNSLDKKLGHFKRYDKSTLSSILKLQKLQVTHAAYFNFAGIFGWWFTGKILNKENIPDYQLSIFNKLTPLFRVIDKLIFHKAGLSIIAVGKRGGEEI